MSKAFQSVITTGSGRPHLVLVKPVLKILHHVRIVLEGLKEEGVGEKWNITIGGKVFYSHGIR